MIVGDRAAYARWRDRFTEAMDPQFYTPQHLDSLISTGRATFMEGTAAAIVVEIKAYPGGARVVCGLVAAGDLNEIVERLIPEAETFGKLRGCTHGMVESREGWARALKDSGYSVWQTTLVKAL